MPMRVDCKYYESRTYSSGEVVRKCRIDLAPEAPCRFRHARRDVSLALLGSFRVTDSGGAGWAKQFDVVTNLLRTSVRGLLATPGTARCEQDRAGRGAP